MNQGFLINGVLRLTPKLEMMTPNFLGKGSVEGYSGLSNSWRTLLTAEDTTKAFLPQHTSSFRKERNGSLSLSLCCPCHISVGGTASRSHSSASFTVANSFTLTPRLTARVSSTRCQHFRGPFQKICRQSILTHLGDLIFTRHRKKGRL